MAANGPKVTLVFAGDDSKLSKTIASVQAKTASLEKAGDRAGSGLASIGKGLAALGAAGSAVQTIGGVAGAVAQLAPAALLLPGALLAGAAAMSTFKIATAGMGDAISAGLSGDMEAFAEATADMHPEMAAAAKAVADMKPEVDGLKRSVQGKFWDGFSDGIKSAGQKYLPILDKGLGDIATQMGTVAFEGLKATQSPFFTGAVGSILKSTAGFFREVGTGAGDVATGVVGIGKVGAQYLPRLGESVGGVAMRFRDWVEANSEAGGAIERMIDSAIQGAQDLGGIVKNVGSIIGSVFRGLGTDMSSPLASLRELTGQVAEFLKTAEAQDGLRALGETLRVIGDVVGRVVMTALRELAPTLVEIAPVAQEVAETLGDMLVAALETVGPLLRGVADIAGDYPSVVGAATVAVVGFVVAVKTMKVLSMVSGWASSAASGLDDLGRKADGAGGKVDGFGRRLGGLKGIAGGLALGVAAAGMNDINVAAAGGEQNLQGMEENLNDLNRVLTGDWGNPFADIDAQLAATNRNIQSGESLFGQFLGSIKRGLTEPLPPIQFDVNTGPAVGQVDGFINDVNSRAPQVNINGNTNGAGFALRQILSEIAAGKESVVIDGQPVPAQEALRYVTGLIDNSAGTVDINGNRVPAGQALSGFLGQANGSRASVQVGANTAGAQASMRSFVTTWNGYTIRTNAVVSSRVGGMAAGGPVVGPGSGTSDTAGIFALSNGEYVATAAQVDAAGGPQAFGRLMEAVERGSIRGLAAGGSASPLRSTAPAALRSMPTGPGARGGGAQVTFAGNTSDALATVIMQMVRTGKIQIKAAA